MTRTATPKPAARGGRRRGAGRKPRDPGGPMRRANLWLTPTQIATAERIGGSVQAGIRALLDREAGAA